MPFIYFRSSFCVLIILACVTGAPPTASSNAVGDADQDLFRYIHEDMENGIFDASLPIIERMGEPRIYAGIFMLLCAFGNERMFETGKLGAAAFMEAAFVAYSLKKIVGRPRPLDEAEKDSFPSGHTTVAFTMATVVGHEYTKLRIPLYVAALGTAFSRIYSGRHYPSDVIAGAFIGTLAGWHTIHYRGTVLKFSF